MGWSVTQDEMRGSCKGPKEVKQEQGVWMAAWGGGQPADATNRPGALLLTQGYAINHSCDLPANASVQYVVLQQKEPRRNRDAGQQAALGRRAPDTGHARGAASQAPEPAGLRCAPDAIFWMVIVICRFSGAQNLL